MDKPNKFNLKREDFPDEQSFKKEYDRLYSLAGKKRRRELYQLNKEHEKKQQREYRKRNPEYFKEVNRKRNENYYSNKEKQKISVVRGWKNAGIRISDDTFDIWYGTTHCESCQCELIKGKGMGKNKKVLDHDHFSGYPRHIICHSCNVWRRGYDNRMMKVHLEIHRMFSSRISFDL
jgi:hypothetical protein